MNEALNTIFTAVLTIAVPVVSGLIIQAVQKVTDAITAKAQSETVTQILAEISEAVKKAVYSTSQTYVDALKASGEFTAAAQQLALQKALDACLNSLSQSAKDYIQSTAGDVNKYLTTQIEAEVKAQKIWTPTATTAAAAN